MLAWTNINGTLCGFRPDPQPDSPERAVCIALAGLHFKYGVPAWTIGEEEPGVGVLWYGANTVEEAQAAAESSLAGSP